MATEKRLIDVDVLIAILEEIADEDESEYFHLDEITQEIFDAPTVDAVEVVHGDWTIIENDYDGTTTLECSVCEMSFCFEEYDGLLQQAQTYHYCPNCGAKMDGDGNG